MNYTLVDGTRALVAALLYIPLLVLPGVGIAGLSGALGFWRQGAGSKIELSLISAFALLPAIDSLTVRFGGIPAGIALNLLLACAGIGVLVRARIPLRPRLSIMLVLLAWAAVVAHSLFDLQWGKRLYVTDVTVDLVKHAATIQSLFQTGAPPADPFFARPGASGYYYFFYTPAALAEGLGRGLVDARAAYTGLVFWTGPAVLALASQVMIRCGYAPEGERRRYRPVLIALIAICGLDILPVAMIGASDNLLADMSAWNEEVTPWLLSLVWVPHHLTALIASWAAFLALSEAVSPPEAAAPAGRRALVSRVLFAAIALDSAFGCSIWVTLGTAATVALWGLTLLAERRWLAIGLIALAGVAALALAAPDLHDLAANRHDHAMPIGLTIRAFKPFDVLVGDDRPLVLLVGRAVLLPLNYALEFGVFLIGAWLFLRNAKPGDLFGRETPRLLTLSAVAGLLLGTFTRSTVLYNDLGWRVMLFPQLALLVWSAVAFRRLIDEGEAGLARRSPLLVTALALAVLLGYASTLYGLGALRMYGPVKPPPYLSQSPADAELRLQLRQAFEWLAQNVPVRDVVQQNPRPKRVFDFGLFGRNRTAVADRDAMLFGASRAEVFGRLVALGPIFNADLPAAEVKRRAEANGVDELVVTAKDPAWSARGSWVWTAPAAFATPRVRVIQVAGL